MKNIVRGTFAAILVLSGCDGGNGAHDAGPREDAGPPPVDAGPRDAGPADIDAGGDGTVRCMATVTALDSTMADPFAGAIGAGDTVMIEFNFDPTVADDDTATGTGHFVFTAPPAGITLQVESWTFSPDPTAIDCEASTANDDATYHDNFEMDCYGDATTPAISGFNDTDLYVLLRDSTNAWRSSDALPTGNWNGFDTGEFGVNGYDTAGDPWAFGGTIESCE